MAQDSLRPPRKHLPTYRIAARPARLACCCAAELVAEGAVGVAVAAAVVVLCGVFGACSAQGDGLVAAQLTNYVVFTAVHVLLHTAILAAAYR